MSKKDVLAELNARLRLGEWFPLPIRSRFRTNPKGLVFKVSVCDKGFFVGYTVAKRVSGCPYVRVTIDRGDYYELLELPDGCPPFEQWGRSSR